MGQTVRQSMPSNAHYAFMQPAVNERHSPHARADPSKFPTYSYTIGVCFVRDHYFVASLSPA